MALRPRDEAREAVAKLERLQDRQYCEDDDCRVCGKPKRPWSERRTEIVDE